MRTRSTASTASPAPGATVLVRAHDGRFLARAPYSPHSQIRARVWSFDEAEPIDHAFFKRRVQRAIAHRKAMVHDTGAVRLIFGEADGLPGLIVDHYVADDDRPARPARLPVHGDGRRGTGRRRSSHALIDATGCPNVYERSDVSIRAEGRARTDHRRAGRRTAVRHADRERKRRALSRRRAQRPQDRLLRRSARQPRAGAGAARRTATC